MRREIFTIRGFCLKISRTEPILQDLHCPRRGKWLSCRICIVPAGESGYLAGFALSPLGKVVILQDLHCPRWEKWLSCRICVVPAGESASPAGFALSPLGTAVIGADWKIPAHKIPVMLPFLMLPLHGMEIIFIFARTRFDK